MPRPPSDANVAAIEKVDSIMADPPKALRKLLESHGLPSETLPERLSSKKGTENRLAKMGIGEQAKAWRQSFSKACRPIFPGRSFIITREIAWRLVEAKAMIEKDNWLAIANINTKDVPTDPAVAALPADIRWVYLHPGLVAPGKKDDPVVAVAVAAYEDEHPCPSNGARNRLNNTKKTPKLVDDFMKHVDRLLMGETSRRRGKPDAPPSDNAMMGEEEEAIADLENRLYAEESQFNASAIGEKDAGSFESD